jgi:hypothetical protein
LSNKLSNQSSRVSFLNQGRRYEGKQRLPTPMESSGVVVLLLLGSTKIWLGMVIRCTDIEII